jgi:hypothetical protein
MPALSVTDLPFDVLLLLVPSDVPGMRSLVLVNRVFRDAVTTAWERMSPAQQAFAYIDCMAATAGRGQVRQFDLRRIRATCDAVTLIASEGRDRVGFTYHAGERVAYGMLLLETYGAVEEWRVGFRADAKSRSFGNNYVILRRHPRSEMRQWVLWAYTRGDGQAGGDMALRHFTDLAAVYPGIRQLSAVRLVARQPMAIQLLTCDVNKFLAGDATVHVVGQ